VDLAAEEKVPARFVVKFTEDSRGSYINGKKFATDDTPMGRAKVGTYQHWKIVNSTQEVHPMHIHQVHFLAYARNGQPERP
jgi:suppressor of ftsI